MFIEHPEFGKIVDFDQLRRDMKPIYDAVHPDFNMLRSMQAGTEQFKDEPSHMIAAGASMLAYMLILAADEPDLAGELKNSIFTLGWTEEAIGSDLLSLQTQATPMSDEPDEKEFYLKGGKWLINNSYHADYHMVLAKIDPEQDGPRSMSLFLVPRSSTNGWQRLETHVLKNMVLTEFNIDGPGRLVGKRGYGLTIVQRMALASRFQCSYVGIRMLGEAIPATIDHLSNKRIFGDNPINFSNVFRQMYNLCIQSAFLNFIYYRSIAFSDTSFLSFYGTLLKSWLLLKANELLGQNLLVAGSKGFIKSSVIGRNAIDSFVLPVFDGHYTINTLMTAKHLKRYLNASNKINTEDRLNVIRTKMYREFLGDQINASLRELRNPEFFDYADYIEQLNIPLEFDAQNIVKSAQILLDEIESLDLFTDADHRYKMGMLLHWLESIIAACELWAVTQEDNYLNVIVQQYNGLVELFNTIVSESNLSTDFMTPIHQVSISGDTSDAQGFLLRLHDIETLLTQQQAQAIPE